MADLIALRRVRLLLITVCFLVPVFPIAHSGAATLGRKID
jgi:hypothetical protein